MSGLKHTLEVIEETIEKGLEAVHLKKKDVDAHKENGTVSVETENLAMPEIHLKKKKRYCFSGDRKSGHARDPSEEKRRQGGRE